MTQRALLASPGIWPNKPIGPDWNPYLVDAKAKYKSLVALANRDALPAIGRVVLSEEAMGGCADDLNNAVRGCVAILKHGAGVVPEMMLQKALYTLAEIDKAINEHGNRRQTGEGE